MAPIVLGFDKLLVNKKSLVLRKLTSKNSGTALAQAHDDIVTAVTESRLVGPYIPMFFYVL